MEHRISDVIDAAIAWRQCLADQLCQARANEDADRAVLLEYRIEELEGALQLLIDSHTVH
jgi:hypothetical protein